jgi:hypothetical protein
LIVVVLLLDMGLAVAGAWMLGQGLGDRSSAAAPRTGAHATATSGPPARTVELIPIEPGPGSSAMARSADRPPAATGASTGASSGATAGATVDASVAAGSESSPARSR